MISNSKSALSFVLVQIDLDEVKKDWFQSTPMHIKTIADHYGIYEHLYGDAYFIPRVPLNVGYNLEDSLIPVYYGNVIKPNEAQRAPEVTFESNNNDLWTLILTNPDGHFTKQDSEYVHWFM